MSKNIYRNVVFASICALMPAITQAKLVNSNKNQQPAPFSFVENKGQVTDQHGTSRADIDYRLELPGMNVFVGDGQLHYQWNKMPVLPEISKELPPHEYRKKQRENLEWYKKQKIESYRMDVVLLGANTSVAPVAEEKQDYYENYYVTTYKGQVYAYNKLTYKNIYPNIDWVIYTQGNELKYDFVVHAGGNAADIKLQYKGADMVLNAGKTNGYTASTPFGKISEQQPYTYNAATRQEIPSKFILKGHTISFDVAPQDGDYVIDPTINWVTYYGGSSSEWGYALTADAAGAGAMGGWTNSANNIASIGAHQATLQGGNDAYAVKFNANGTRAWGTYFGSVNTGEEFWGAAVDNAGNFYFAGEANTGSNLATPGAHQTTIGGAQDALLVKFSTAGTLIWSTYFGGTNTEWENHVSCDNGGNVFLSGETSSSNAISSGPGVYQPNLSGASDLYVAKFSSAGVLQWGTYFGGTTNEQSWGGACDNAGAIYITGWTQSTTGIASGPGVHQPTHAGTTTWDGCLAKFSSTGALLWSTYYGGAQQDVIYDVSCDNFNNAYITGYTYSPTGIATVGSHQATLSGAYDGFLVKFDATGVRQWGTYFGGSTNEYLWGCAATSGNLIYTTGWTSSTTGIATPGAYQTTLGGSQDVFMLEWDNTGLLRYGTYIGGPGIEYGYGSCAWSTAGYVYVSGYTQSTTGLATTNGFQQTMGGVTDAFMASFITDTIVYIKQPFNDTIFCPGDSVKVPYGVTYNFRPGNTFTVQLSDATGSFVTPVNIGSLAQVTDDTVRCRIPRTTVASNQYRIRIVASNPVRTSADNGKNIRVKPLPANVLATSNAPVCDGAVLTFNATATAPTPISYEWTGPLSFSASFANPAINPVALTHAGDYIVKATADGCIAYDTVTVDIKPNPLVPLAGSNSPVCPGSTINLSANSGTPGVTYSWTGPGSFISALQNPVINNAQPLNAGQYSVKATLNGCTSAAGVTTVQVQVTTPSPTAAGNTPICSGSDLNLTASTIVGATYEWTGPAGFFSTTQNPTINNVTPIRSGDYHVRAFSNGCWSIPSTVNIIVNTVSFIGGYATPNDTVCTGTQVTFVALSQNTGPTPVYQWYKNYQPVAGANGLLYPVGTVATGDVFYCTMHAVGVCPDPVNVSTDTITMTVIPTVTTPDVTITANPSQPKPGQPILFTADITGGGYQPTYQWQRNGQNVFGAIHANWSTNNLSPFDEVRVIAYTSDPCAQILEDTSNTIIVNFTTSVSNVEGSDVMALYPNPNNGGFTIAGKTLGSDVKLQVLNAVGQVVYEEVASATGRQLKHVLNLQGKLAAGVYVLRADDDGAVSNIRFTVQ